MRHKKIKFLLGAYMDGELEEKEKEIIEKHLEACDECLSEIALLRKIENCMGKYCEPEDIYWKTFSERVKERILKREREAKSPFLKNIFIKPVSLRLAGAIVSITIIAILSIFYYENFKSPVKITPHEKEYFPSEKKDQSDKVKKDTYGKEEFQSVPSPEKIEKRETKTPFQPEKRLSEKIAKAKEQKQISRAGKEEVALEEKRISHEGIVLEKKEGERGVMVSGVKRSLEEVPEEEKIYQEGLRLQREGKYEEAMQNYLYIINNYPRSKRAPQAHFQVNTISFSGLERPLDEVSLRKKIQSWKDFIKRYPDSELIPSAKRNLAELSYQLALLTKDKNDIENAISAIEDFLRSSEVEKFLRMLEELRKMK